MISLTLSGQIRVYGVVLCECRENPLSGIIFSQGRPVRFVLVWVGMAVQKGLPRARAGSNRFGYPRNSMCVGGKGKDQRQQQKEQGFSL